MGRVARRRLAVDLSVLLLALGMARDAGAPVAASLPEIAVAAAVKGGNLSLDTSGLRVVALGDSVPSGAACDCEPFPVLYGRLLAVEGGVPVNVDDRGVAGLTTDGLLHQLDGAGSTASSVAGADVVLVTIGANDFEDNHDAVAGGRCDQQPGADCVADELSALGSTLAAVLDRVHALRGGRPTTVLVTGYWNVFQDGDVAQRRFTADGIAASVLLTRRSNSVVQVAAVSAGDDYVDLFRAFRTAPRRVTDLLAPDGDHPDARGHALIARTLLKAGLPGLRFG